MKNYSKKQCEVTIINTLKGDRNNALIRLFSSAIYCAFNPAEGKKGLQDIYIKQGYTRSVKGNIYPSMMADRDIKAAIKLSDIDGAALFEMVKDASTEKDLQTKGLQFLTLKYAPESLPLNINNKFLPMLTEGWTFEQACEEQSGRVSIEGNNPEGTNNDEGEAEALGNAGTDKAELTPAKEKKTNAMLFNEHATALLTLVKNMKNGDKPLILEALHFAETITRASLLALDVHSLTNAKGEAVVMAQGDNLAIDIIAQKLKLARQSVDAVSKPEIVIKKKGTKTKKGYVTDAVAKIAEANPNFKVA